MGYGSARGPCFSGYQTMRCTNLCIVLVTAASVSLSPVEVGAQGMSAERLHGCWRREAPKRIDDPHRKAFVDLCFRSDGTVYQVAIAPEGGRDELFDWSLLNDSELVINRQTCGALIKQDLEQRFLFLSTYLHGSVDSPVHTHGCNAARMFEEGVDREELGQSRFCSARGEISRAGVQGREVRAIW